MDLAKRLDYTKELTRDFVFTYTSIFKTEPAYAVIDYNSTSFEDAYTSMKSKKDIQLFTPTFWEYQYKSYCEMWKKEHVTIDDAQLAIHSVRTPVIIDMENPSKVIGFFNMDFQSEFPYDLCIDNVWLDIESEEVISTIELYRILFTYSQQWYKKLKSNMSHIIRLPWPDDAYMQNFTFNLQATKVVEAVPNTKIMSTTLIKTGWEVERNIDRFQDNGYKVLECLPNDIFNSPALMHYFLQLCDKRNITAHFPSSSLLTKIFSYLRNKSDDEYKDFKSTLWHYVYSKAVHLLIFMEDEEIIGHLEYMDTNDHSIQIKSYVFLTPVYERQYSREIMSEFLYDCQQGNVSVISAIVNSANLREYLGAFNFKIAEVNLTVPSPK